MCNANKYFTGYVPKTVGYENSFTKYFQTMRFRKGAREDSMPALPDAVHAIECSNF